MNNGNDLNSIPTYIIKTAYNPASIQPVQYSIIYINSFKDVEFRF